MIRLGRRHFLSAIFGFLAIVLPTWYLLAGPRFNYQTGESVVGIIVKSDGAKKERDGAGLEDYEFSKLLLPTANRGASAVESGNLSYDQIRHSSIINRSSATGGARFDAEGVSSADVLVFLHIQKTGGTTFERYLVRQLQVPRPCQCRSGRKRCRCRRPNNGLWLFSRFSNGWPCGLHADYTELVASGCVQRVLDRQEKADREKPRRYFLTTFLREPIARYYSEYRHVTERGATWAATLHVCNGRRATSAELPPCYDPQSGWVGASLREFVDCPYNVANNRQTRMLADLTLVNCYNNSGVSTELRDATMLRSAKVNLHRMAYFGLQEDMRRSQYIFERTFGLDFAKPLLNWNETSDITHLSPEQLENIRRANRLDLELYEYARKLFAQRFAELKGDDPLYDVNMAT